MNPPTKKPLTVAEMAAMGGKARWQTVSKQDRSEAMRRAVNARWSKRPERADDLQKQGLEYCIDYAKKGCEKARLEARHIVTELRNEHLSDYVRERLRADLRVLRDKMHQMQNRIRLDKEAILNFAIKEPVKSRTQCRET